jgi:hypothetical protein
MLMGNEDDVSRVSLFKLIRVSINNFFACYFKGVVTKPVNVLYHVSLLSPERAEITSINNKAFRIISCTAI